MALYSSSGLSTARACFRKYFYSHEQRIGRESRGGSLFNYMTDGLAVHKGLEVWYSTKDTKRALVAISKWIKEHVGWSTTLWAIEKPYVREHMKYLQRLICAYIRRYSTEDHLRVIATELKFMVPIGSGMAPERPFCECGWEYPEDVRRGFQLVEYCPVCGRELDYFIGIIDLIVEDQATLDWEIVDHKTKDKSTSANYLEAFDESAQLQLYRYGASQSYARTINTAWANILVKLKLIDKRGDPFHRSEPLTVIEDEQALFIRERKADIDAIRAERAKFAAGDTTAWRRNPDRCRDFGICSFYELCWPSREQWWEIPENLANEFEIREFDFLSGALDG